MIYIFSDEVAGRTLEEIGDLQRQVESGTGLELAGQEITDRARAVTEYFLAKGSTNVFEPLVKPLMEWAIYSLAPIFLTDETNGASYRGIYNQVQAFYNEYTYLDPSS